MGGGGVQGWCILGEVMGCLSENVGVAVRVAGTGLS